MAKIYPSGWKEVRVMGAAQREIETLAWLGERLPDSYAVYHGVHWSRVNDGFAIFGEVDFAVLAPTGRLLLIEQKSGFLKETDAGLIKIYANRDKSVVTQMARTVDQVYQRLKATLGASSFRIDALLYCPDYTIRRPEIAGLDPSRIVDASRKDQLDTIIEAIMPASETALSCRDQIGRFLVDELELAADPSAMLGEAQQWVTRLSGGLAKWARCLQMEPFRLRVSGTAGSGKTQLAIKVLEDNDRLDRRTLYVCYNRPLADRVAQLAPASAHVLTFHQLCHQLLTKEGQSVDFSTAHAFEQLEQLALALPASAVPTFDTLIVDEGQDFSAAWRDLLLRMLDPKGQAWWLEDPLQNLYFREPVQLEGWAVLRANENYRSPRDILNGLKRLVPGTQDVIPASPFTDSDQIVLTYTSEEQMLEVTKRAITQALGAGYRQEDIALLSFRGRIHSALSSLQRLGPYRLKQFTGNFDLFGNPEYSSGEVMTESVYRFKGQSAGCVIFTEIDFDTFDERAARKIFVGMTRARMKLILIMSERAARELNQAIS